MIIAVLADIVFNLLEFFLNQVDNLETAITLVYAPAWVFNTLRSMSIFIPVSTVFFCVSIILYYYSSLYVWSGGRFLLRAFRVIG